MLFPTTVTPASTVKLWPVFAGLTVTLEKLPVMYRRSIGLTLLLDCVIWTLFNVTFKMEDHIDHAVHASATACSAGTAGFRRIVGTLEITADHDAGTGKPAVSGA